MRRRSAAAAAGAAPTPTPATESLCRCHRTAPLSLTGDTRIHLARPSANAAPPSWLHLHCTHPPQLDTGHALPVCRWWPPAATAGPATPSGDNGLCPGRRLVRFPGIEASSPRCERKPYSNLPSSATSCHWHVPTPLRELLCTSCPAPRVPCLLPPLPSSTTNCLACSPCRQPLPRTTTICCFG